MDERGIESALATCERGLAAGEIPDLRASGFWRVVGALKRRPELVPRYAERVAAVDRATFKRRVRLVFPATLGVVLLVGGLVVDVVFLALAPTQVSPWREILLLAGAVGLDVAVHGIGHLVVGSAVGIRFTDWFVDLPKRPQPGFKIDYASYLRTPARSRAWMHAAGAIATKLAPFVVLVYALMIGADAWAIAALVLVGVLQIVSDATLSVKSSDWKKFRREMRYAKPSPRAS